MSHPPPNTDKKANWNPKEELVRLEAALGSTHSDFSAAYMAVQNLHALALSHPSIIGSKTIAVLKDMLTHPVHTFQKMSFFLYKEAADTLVSILIHSPEKSLAARSLAALRHVIVSVSGNRQRAAAEALGTLPLQIYAPEFCENLHQDIPLVTWNRILSLAGINAADAVKRLGRSIVVKPDNSSTVLVVKTTAAGNSVDLLNREALWMDALNSGSFFFAKRFEIPQPLRIGENFVFRLQNPPLALPGTSDSNKNCFAIAFNIHENYFCYPNGHESDRRLGNQDFKEILFRNAWLLGRLASMGIVHLAPIPLFHNRIQQTRRTDRGIYEWVRGGRLDRWLHSCRYPNFGLTGLRDFEHLATIQEAGGKIYQQIGTHLLSLLLVAGSYFRNKDADRYGLNDQGDPVDTRDLFEKSFFKELIEGVFLNYYSGFARETFQEKIPVSSEQFVMRLIDAMGVDRHMQEILRVFDQRAMTDREFEDFLKQSGFTGREITRVKKGEQDITLQTGPHLGGFNQRISIPELIEFVSAASAFCVAGKYRQQKNDPLH